MVSGIRLKARTDQGDASKLGDHLMVEDIEGRRMTAEEIVNRIRDHLKENSPGLEDGGSGITENSLSRKLDWGSLDADLRRASAHSTFASISPAMSHHPPILRMVARLSARTVLYLSKFITAVQSLFNAAVLRVLQHMRNLFYEVENRLNSLSQRIAKEEERTTSILAQLPVITARIQDLEKGSEENQNQYQEILSELDFVLGEKISRDEGRMMLAQLYPALEDRLRGPREEIKERQSIYVSRLREADIGSPERPVLDLGCGRGEWLELLEEAGFHGVGVDIHPGMVKICAERDLNVIQKDAIQYLRETEADSLGAVTCFHLLEHLPPELILSLLSAGYRCLKKDGLLIIETPNPENPYVGSCGIHLDPTHNRPLPWQLLSFLLERLGFNTPELLRLNPVSGAEETKTAGFNLDYALVAQKGDHTPAWN